MADMNPQTVAERWAQRLGGATEKMRAGAQSVTTAPGQSAAAAADTWQTRVSSAEAKSKFANNVARVSLSDWQNAYLNKGLQRIASGATASVPKMAQFLTTFLPFVNQVASRVRTMPKATLEDRINRMVAQIRGTAAYKRS